MVGAIKVAALAFGVKHVECPAVEVLVNLGNSCVDCSENPKRDHHYFEMCRVCSFVVPGVCIILLNLQHSVLQKHMVQKFIRVRQIND